MSLATMATVETADFINDPIVSLHRQTANTVCVRFCVCYLSRERGPVPGPCHLARVELSGDLSQILIG